MERQEDGKTSVYDEINTIESNLKPPRIKEFFNSIGYLQDCK